MAIHDQVGVADESNTLIVDTSDGSLRFKRTNFATNGAITIKSGMAHLTKGSAGAYTLAAPTSGAGYDGDNGKVLHIRSTTAFAHTIVVAGGINGGANTTFTLGGAVGDGVSLYADAGVWRVLYSINAAQS